jgi:ubiquinone/menaquinone biosynthesis C-methylase UbiE
MSKDVYTEIDRDSSRERLLKYTRKAFKLLPRLDKPRILDAGCGSGLPTIELAKLSNGKVVGIDIDQSLLIELKRKIEREDLSDRVETRKCSVFELDFPDETFNIVWFEGATRMIGFEKALKEWRRLLKPNGFLVIHDEIKTVSNKLEEIPSLGYKVINQFFLPEDAWWIEYYRPLENRIKGLREKYKDNLEVLRTLKEVQDEIDMVKGKPEEYRSAFYIMQKT